MRQKRVLTHYDAVVVGSGPAGSATATLLARHGARVALLERSPDPAHHKALCTHELLESANDVFRRLGIYEELRELGGERRSPEVWTRYGWVRPGDAAPGREEGLNVRRTTLDPILRELASSTDGVELQLGRTVTSVLRDGSGRPCGVIARTKDGDEDELRARVVIGADGRGSDVARLAGVAARTRAHARFGYAAYYENVPKNARGAAQMWLQEPDVAYQFPTDGGLTVLALAPLRTPQRLQEFKTDLEGAFLRAFAELPDGPDLSSARRAGKFVGLIKMDNARRPAGLPGIAFVGDAAQTSDFLWGTGVGYAVRSAAWLADAVGPALARRAPDATVDRALRRYRRTHTRMLGMHHAMTSDYSTGRPFNVPERLLFAGGAHDPKVAQTVGEIASRSRPFYRTVTPGVLARAAVVTARARRRGYAPSTSWTSTDASSSSPSAPAATAAPTSSGDRAAA